MRLFHQSVVVGGLAFALVAAGPTPAQAQGVEIGSSLISGMFTTGEDDVSIIGIPSGGFGILNPTVYASLFLGSRVAVEPQIGLLWASFDGDSGHTLNFAGQFDYFVQGADRSSPYLLASAGILNTTGEDYSPKSFGGGVGYRVLSGDRVALRFDVRYTHYTSEDTPFDNEGTNTVALTVSIGGVFGRR